MTLQLYPSANTKEKRIWLQTGKGIQNPIVWWRKPTKEQLEGVIKAGYEIKEAILLWN